MGGCAAATAAHFLGALATSWNGAGAMAWPQWVSQSVFLPLVYVGAFVALPRGAARLCGALCLGAAMGALALGVHDLDARLGFTLLVAHPLLIMALHHISVLHERLDRSEAQAQAGKERFLALLSHEIRTPLQAMLGSIDLLALRASGAAQERAIERMRRASDQLAAHLRDATENARLDIPTWQLHLAPTDLVQLVHDVCDSHRPRFQARGLNLRCESIPSPRLNEALTDPARLRQILDNLLNNALKYTPHGEVSVALHEATPGHGLLSVTDTGVGMPPDALPTIFEPGVRLHNPRLGWIEGSGLGLTVVRRLVERLQGDLSVASTLEVGTRFELRLPL